MRVFSHPIHTLVTTIPATSNAHNVPFTKLITRYLSDFCSTFMTLPLITTCPVLYCILLGPTLMF
ncbi:hypothetical protein L218DRAFT_958913 [Marasmius fiardii PR-910]|nr:hypothetical protein L218DRAFT_958913 [Marasmius fiardii PR-910]